MKELQASVAQEVIKKPSGYASTSSQLEIQSL